MRKRSQSREYAVQLLYQLDITKNSAQDCITDFWQEAERLDTELSVREFTEKLVNGTADKIEMIDKKIAHYATNWQIERMAVVDRNVLRMGAYELIFLAEIPPKVSINEAVELAKKYSGQEAGKFINAILDKIKIEFKR